MTCGRMHIIDLRFVRGKSSGRAFRPAVFIAYIMNGYLLFFSAIRMCAPSTSITKIDSHANTVHVYQETVCERARERASVVENENKKHTTINLTLLTQ